MSPFVVVISLRQKNYSVCPRKGTGVLASFSTQILNGGLIIPKATQQCKNVDKLGTLRRAACSLLYEWLMGKASQKVFFFMDTLWAYPIGNISNSKIQLNINPEVFLKKEGVMEDLRNCCDYYYFYYRA